MPPVLKIYRSGTLIKTVGASEGETLYERIIASDIYLEAPCGGKGKCGKCLVQLAPDGPKVRACQTLVTGDMEVYLPDELKMKIAGADSKGRAAAYQGPLGRRHRHRHHDRRGAPDGYPDLHAPGHRQPAVNAQRTYGADVISRIQYCAENGHETLTRAIRTQLAGLIARACKTAGASPKDIHYISIAGNTIMQHLAAGLSPVGMGVAPFTPVTLFGDERPAGHDLPAADDAVIYYAPCVYSYVGGDITAGMLASSFKTSRETASISISAPTASWS